MKVFNCESVLQGAIDIDSNWVELKSMFPDDFNFPNQLIDKLENVGWYRGRSKWLIYPNKKGSAINNSFTQYCPLCILEKAYYQQKWKVSIFSSCAEHNLKLHNKCPNCGNTISPLKSEMRTFAHDELSPLFHCWFCKFDIRSSPIEVISSDQHQYINEITISYSETPCNLVYLKYRLNSLP